MKTIPLFRRTKRNNEEQKTEEHQDVQETRILTYNQKNAESLQQVSDEVFMSCKVIDWAESSRVADSLKRGDLQVCTPSNILPRNVVCSGAELFQFAEKIRILDEYLKSKDLTLLQDVSKQIKRGENSNSTFSRYTVPSFVQTYVFQFIVAFSIRELPVKEQAGSVSSVASFEDITAFAESNGDSVGMFYVGKGTST
eukprot:NP_510620.1 Uncharacterized protein CELE_C09G1.3 [Caenorhabditis elegans]